MIPTIFVHFCFKKKRRVEKRCPSMKPILNDELEDFVCSIKSTSHD